ncbi:MAG: hypothetical protein HC940_04535 [Acaryochloris sp. SU_5_25]|nr:hypothetical protein [Acaryochloris sp. SU_5_25]
MKLTRFLLGVMLLNCLILQGCKENASLAKVPHTENKSLVTNQEMNRSIEDYVDKYLSEIIRIRNFNPERVQKVFCVHHTVYVETAITAPDAINAYVKLLCLEGKKSTASTALISNPTGLVSKIDIQRSTQSSTQKGNQERFKVVSDETPRDMPFYLEDLRRILSNDLMDKINQAQFDEKADYEKIRKKALAYQKSLQSNCQR